MKDFLKAAEKLLVLKQDPNKPLVPRILRSLYYAEGKVYATDSAAMIWSAAPSEQYGAYDYDTGEKYDVKLNVNRAIPDTDKAAMEVTLNRKEASTLLQALKPLSKLFDKGDQPVISLCWKCRELTIKTHTENLSACYQFRLLGAAAKPDEAICMRLMANRLVIILDYILHVSECFTIYVSPKCPVLFQGATAGAVLALCKDPAK